MGFLVSIAADSVVPIILLLFGLQLAARETGYWFGRRHATRNAAEPDGVGVVVGAMLGLLAFVLALTLSFASGRFSERRAGTLAEANAIGTAWLRAEAIGQPRGYAIAHLLEDYTRVRATYVAAPGDAAELDRLNTRTNALQSEIWGHAAALAREQPNPVMASLLASLNDTFDMTTAERFAFAYRLPAQLFWLLIGMIMLGMAALGFQLGLRATPVRMLATLLTAMWTFVVVDILDLSAARVGSFRTDTAAYVWTLQGFGKDVVIAPAPELRGK